MLSLSRLLPVLMAVIVAFIAGTVRAQNEESEETRLSAEKAKRHYAGGKDEQELTVQAVLAQPTRYPTDPKPALGAAKEPVQEDLHD